MAKPKFQSKPKPKPKTLPKALKPRIPQAIRNDWKAPPSRTRARAAKENVRTRGDAKILAVKAAATRRLYYATQEAGRSFGGAAGRAVAHDTVPPSLAGFNKQSYYRLANKGELVYVSGAAVTSGILVRPGEHAARQVWPLEMLSVRSKFATKVASPNLTPITNGMSSWFVELSHANRHAAFGREEVLNAMPSTVGQNTQQLVLENIAMARAKADPSLHISMKVTDYVNAKTGIAEYRRLKYFATVKSQTVKIVDERMVMARGDIGKNEVSALTSRVTKQIADILSGAMAPLKQKVGKLSVMTPTDPKTHPDSAFTYLNDGAKRTMDRQTVSAWLVKLWLAWKP
ncbi:hypothetical protein M0D69_31775 [Caballeronia sp. SEWSISQ10-4 2]|uniref:hypothetical protein n=1 Tax=Caballeronia sp. SEWSISQ10-4 2 TaxID=2937438 RepID=UPI00264F6086|nr:hypothetical protein [Caballeronia sp. SEWSISQ10-4 2]MDN7182521.1 hypothetical protein [Caballeronia sp. SEWSISQ10-4 2]